MWKLLLYTTFFAVLFSSPSVAELRGSLSTSSSSSSLWSPLKETKEKHKEMENTEIGSHVTIGNKDANMVRMLPQDDQEPAGRGNDKEFASIPNWDHQHLDFALHNSNLTWRDSGEGGQIEDVQRRRRLQFTMSTLEKRNGRYVNQTRVANNVTKIQWSQDCLEQAQAHASYMAGIDTMVNRNPLSTGITNWTMIAENVCQAKNATKDGCFTNLLNNADSFANMVNPNYTHIGIGVNCSSNWCYLCQIYKRSA